MDIGFGIKGKSSNNLYMNNKILILFIVLMCACSSTKITNNAPSSYTFTTTKPFEEVWSGVIDYVASKGVSIKNIDKASGIIITDEYSLINSYTYEDKKGQLINPNAYVVINRIKGGFGATLTPDFVTGNYNIRVKTLDQETSVTVNLVNLKGAVKVDKNMYGGGGRLKYYTIKSTNVFEKQLAENLK